MLALRDHAFQSSHFPLILSLEMHCGQEQIGRIANILDESFGEKLLRHPPEGHENQALVSPLRAMNKVIVKASLVSPEEPSTDSDTDDASQEGNEVGDASKASKPKRSSLMRSGPPTASNARSSFFGVNNTETTQPLARKVVDFNGCIYLVAKKARDIKASRQPCNISSFSEGSAAKFCKNHGNAFNDYHRNNLTRVYPPATNIASSNLSPMVHWTHGAQLVALNFQSTDT